jgi:hypothetical protein
MQANVYVYLGIGAAVVFVVVAVLVSRVLAAKTRLPPLPAFGSLPLADLPRYYALREPGLAWEAVRGWDLNERPLALTAEAPIDQAILTPRLLNFCTGRDGHVRLLFNFLVAAIERVDFDPAALPPGLAPPGFGLATIHTPSGQTLMVASAAFIEMLRNAIAQAR